MDETRNTGFVFLHRRIRKSSIWTDLKPSVLKLAVHYIMEARWQDGKYYDGRQEITVPAGSFVASIRQLAADTGLSVKEIRTAQKHFENIDFAAHVRAPKGAQVGTLITVCNYRTYQATPEAGAQVFSAQGADLGHSWGTGKNKEKKENTLTPPYSPPPQQSLELEPNRRASVGTDPSVTGRTPEGPLERMITETARRMLGRHKRRKCSAKVAMDSLRRILRREIRPPEGLLELLGEIDRCHEAMCASRDWTKDGGEYQQGLETWLNPVKRRWEVWPPDVFRETVTTVQDSGDGCAPEPVDDREHCPICGGRFTVDGAAPERMCRTIGCQERYGDPASWAAAVAALEVTA